MAVLVNAPFRRDEDVILRALAAEGIEGRPTCAHGVSAAPLEEVEALVLSQDALNPNLLGALARALQAQEPWSELPVILLLDEDQQSEQVIRWLERALPRARSMILQRPVRPAALCAAVRTSVSARARQFEVRDHLRWRNELQLEMNHRVKNVLSNALAIFHIARRSSSDPESLARGYEERLLALTRAHEALACASEEQDFASIARASISTYDPAGERVVMSGEPLTLKPTAAVTLALCLHELAADSAADGALASGAEPVELAWGTRGRDAYIAWREPGRRVPATMGGRRHGLGFVEAAATRGFKGQCRLETSEAEFACRLVLPLANIAPTQPAKEIADAHPDC